MRTTKQLSIFGIRRTRVYFRPSAVAIPTTTPTNILPKKTSKNSPIASKRFRKVKEPASLSAYFCAVSNRTMAIASLRMDSPKITVYSFGSTLYKLKMAKMVTGSVAESVAPTEIASTKEMFSASSGIRVHRYKTKPRTMAEIKVPAKAKVRMVPMWRKKFAWCSSYPEARIMGGRRRLKKNW